MIDLKLVQKNPELLAKALADRHSSLSVDEFLTLDGRRRALLAEVEALKQKRSDYHGRFTGIQMSQLRWGNLFRQYTPENEMSILRC